MGSGNTWENKHSELFEHGDPVWEVRRLALIRADNQEEQNTVLAGFSYFLY